MTTLFKDTMMKKYWTFATLVCFGMMTSGTVAAQIPGTFIGANTTNTALADPDAPEPDGTPREDDDFTGDVDTVQGTANLSRWFDGTNTTGDGSRSLVDADGVEIPDSGGFRGATNFFNGVPPDFFGGQITDPGLVTTVTGLNDGDQYEVLFIYAASRASNTMLPFLGQVLAAGFAPDETEQVAELDNLTGVFPAEGAGVRQIFAAPLGTTTVVDGQIQVFVDNLNTGFFDLSTAYNGISITLVSDLPGDFDENGVVDCDDLDGYVGSLGEDAIGALAALDLDGNGTLDATDANTHIMTLVETTNGQVGTFLGDVNCDGNVNVLGDAFALVENLGSTVTTYGEADLNFDGMVNVLGDAFILVGNLGMSNNP